MERTKRFGTSVLRRRAACIPGLLLVMLVTMGEPSFAGATKIGFHIGPSVPNLQGGTNEVSQGYTSRYALYFGFFADRDVRPHVSLRGELNYSSQGGKRNGMQPVTPDPSLPVPPDMKLYAAFDNQAIIDYLEIPLLAELSWGRTMRFFVNAGPYIGFLVRAKTVTRGSSALYVDAAGTPLLVPPDYEPLPPVDFGADTDIKQDINSTNAGIAGGVGLGTPFGPGDIIIDARFAYGLRNIQRDTELNGKNNTGTLAFTVGYALAWK
jgi:hypothetical protein